MAASVRARRLQVRGADLAPLPSEVPETPSLQAPSGLDMEPARDLEQVSVDVLARQLEEERRAHVSGAVQEWALIGSFAGLAAVTWATWTHRHTLPKTVHRTLRRAGISSKRGRGSR